MCSFACFSPSLFPAIIISREFVRWARTILARPGIALGKARDGLGISAFDNDRKRIDIAEGDLHFRRAETSKTVTAFLKEMVEAEKLYRAATDLQPLDIDGYTGLARATAALETVYPFVLRQPFPTKALPDFRTSARPDAGKPLQPCPAHQVLPGK